MKASAHTLTPSRAAIILFCFWHMAAVGLYALPDASQAPIVQLLRDRFQWVARPYILLTSQWQQWNLFSPDPLRRIVTYGIEADRGASWERILTIEPETYSTFRHASQFKFLARFLEGGASSSRLVVRFLEKQCEELNLASGTHVRLVYLVSVIPLPPRSWSVDEWRHVALSVETVPGTEILCGWPADTAIVRPFHR